VFDRILSFFKELPGHGHRDRDQRDDPRVAAAALLYHVMDADGVRHDAEWERLKQVLGESYGVGGEALDRLLQAGADADQEAVDLYAFTSVLKRQLNEAQRVEFIRIMWEVVFADGELHELEDHTLWRVAELMGVDRRERILSRQEARSRAGVGGSDRDGE
jgi:uncharacterized tellurite resistance protein B-like protein